MCSSTMDFLSKDEPLIDLDGFDSPEDLLSDETLQPHKNQRRLKPSSSSSSSRQPRISSNPKVYLRELSPVTKDHNMERHSSMIVSAVEKTMKTYADGVLRVLEGMNGRLKQLELASQDLENAVGALKGLVEHSHKHTDQNFKILSENIMKMHRSLQILRDKQDIFEAHAQLEKLHTSKALAEKESIQGPSTKANADEAETATGNQHQELDLQRQQPQQTSSQPFMPQPLQGMTPQYHVPSTQVQRSGPAHYSAPEALAQVMHPNPINANPLDQVHYHQSPPQHMQVQQPLPSPQQPTFQAQQPMAQQVHHLPMPPQTQISQRLLHEGPGPQPLQITVQVPARTQQLSDQTQFQSAPPQQRQVQQMPPQLGMGSQQPPQAKPLSSSHMQGSFQYYGQSTDSSTYASLPQGPPQVIQGATDTARDAISYYPHQCAPSSIPTQQLLPIQSHQQMSPQVNQAPHDHNVAANVSGPMMWSRQSNAPSVTPRLQTAQVVRPDNSPSEASGVIEKVVAMGFSRDQVQSVIRRLADRNQAVDMNVVLDILMNGGRGSQSGFGR